MAFFSVTSLKTRDPLCVTLHVACLGVVIAGLLGTLACKSKPANSAPMQMDFRVPVTTAKATTKSVPVQVEVIGNVEPYSSVSVRTQIAGQIEKAYFNQGEDVKKGQLLFTLDRRPYDAAIAQLQASLARDQAQLANAKAQAERNEKLFQEGIISKDQYETFRTTAQAQDAVVRSGQASIENAKINLSYCSVYSPIDGRTGSYQVYPGNIAKANDTVLVVINQIHPIYVTFAVPEQYLSEIKRFQAHGRLPVEASIPNDTGAASVGQLIFIDNSVDTATGTIKMRGVFQNPQNRLWPGQFVNVVLRLSTQSGVTVVPSQAVQTGPTGKFVFVIQPDAKGELVGNLHPVNTGATVDGSTVIEKGVASGDTVVTDGQLLLAPGSKVEIKKGSGH